MEKNNFEDRVELITDGHENMKDYVSEEVTAVMFNLGYLPGGSKKDIITEPETTVEALVQASSLLSLGGTITVVLYTGHEGGTIEMDAVMSWCKKLDQRIFTAIHYFPINQRNSPPNLIALKRIGFGQS